MIQISYFTVLIVISVVWIVLRAMQWARDRRIVRRREVQLLLVYICIIVVARFTFFPFATVDGRIQPLLFDAHAVLPLRINLLPFIHLLDYPDRGDAMLNLIGNTAMFIPLGVVWPCVFRELDTPGRAIAAGVGVSLCIEILQLPFFDRVTDIDDLLLNSLGYLLGYALYLLALRLKRRA